MNLEELSDKELFDECQKSGAIEKLTNSPEWKIIKEASERIIDRAVNEFINTKADDTIRIIELQTIIRKYKIGLFSEINVLKQASDLLFEEAKSRGFFEWLDKWTK
jgi:hypothetical protein